MICVLRHISKKKVIAGLSSFHNETAEGKQDIQNTSVRVQKWMTISSISAIIIRHSPTRRDEN